MTARRVVFAALCAVLSMPMLAWGNSAHAATTRASVTVKLTDADQFVPAHVSVHVGDTIRWVNVSSQVHTVTDDSRRAAYAADAALPPGAPAFNSGFLKPGASYTRTFTVPGTYRYFCIPHEGLGMLGTITVVPAGASLPAAVGSGAPVAAKGTPAAQPADAAAFPTHVYVTLQRTGAIEVFPAQTVWPGFAQAHYISSGPGGRIVMASGFQNGNVYLADGTTGKKLATIHVGGLIQGVKIDPSGRYGLAIDASGNSVAVIDLRTRQLLKTIAVGKTPHNAIFTRDGSVAYVTVQGGRAVDVIDMHALRVVKRIGLPQINGPHNLDINVAGTTLWIRSYAQPNVDGEVARLDLRNDRVTHVQTVGLYHGGVDARPAGPYVFATDIGANTLEVLDARTLALVKRIVVGAGPHGVRESPDGKWLYVSDTRSNALVVLDARSLKIVQTLPVKGQNPFWLAVEGNE